MHLTREEVVTLLLHRQGLTDPGYTHAGPVGLENVVTAIRSLGVLQIDTIHVVARSPYIVLWSRLGAFQPDLVMRALEERRIFEYWSHEACFLPIEHLPYSRVLMLQKDSSPRRVRHVQRRIDDAAIIDAVLARADGGAEVRSSDFTRAVPGSSQGWWDWKPEKTALETLFMLGELTVSRRENFHRIYRRWEDQFPELDDASLPDEDTVADQHVRVAVRGLGAGTEAWIADYFRRGRVETKRAVARLVAAGELVPVEIEGEGRGYTDPAALATIAEIRAGQHRPTGTNLLSPFDPIVWDRARALALFGFDYRIECYTPEPKRRYGYFSLPILHEGRLVGRLDPKAHRAERRLEIRAIHLEPGVAIDPQLLDGVATALVHFARWQELDTVEVVASSPPILRRRLGPALRAATRASRRVAPVPAPVGSGTETA